MTAAYAILFYSATLILVIGLIVKIKQYATTTAPLKIPTTPAPTTKQGVVLRMAREIIFFQSLFRANKWIWLFGWMFHIALVLVLVRHLRYFTEPVWSWVALIQPFGIYAAFAFVAGHADKVRPHVMFGGRGFGCIGLGVGESERSGGIHGSSDRGKAGRAATSFAGGPR